MKDNQNIVIWGTKLEAERVLYECQKLGLNCNKIIDEFFEGNFHGIPVHHLEQMESLKGAFCVIACSQYETYQMMKSRLYKKGLNEFCDFIWSKLWLKKIVVINANCHGTVLSNYLNKSVLFSENYAIYPIPEIQLNKDKCIDSELLKVVDVFIHQDIRTDNSVSYKLSDEYILPRLKENCLKICIPNLVGFGTAIFQTNTPNGYVTKGENPALIFFKDDLIDIAYESIKNKTLCNLKKWLEDYQFNREKVLQFFELKLMQLEKREQENWDIKISQYIREHYQTEKMFNDVNHPSEVLMKRICDKVAEILCVDIVNNFEINIGVETYMQPGIRNILGINLTDNSSVSGYNRLGGNKLDWDEYLREYIWCFYGVYLR